MIMPLLGIFTGKIDFAKLFIALDGKTYETLTAAEEAGVACFKYGAFLAGLLDFLIMAFIIFCIIKLLNGMNELAAKLAKKKAEEEVPAVPTTKVCPFCKTEIAIDATRCPHCTSELSE